MMGRWAAMALLVVASACSETFDGQGAEDDTPDTGNPDTGSPDTDETETEETEEPDTSADFCDDPAIASNTPVAGLCVTEELRCGDEITHTTEGGNADFDAAFYDDIFATGPWGVGEDWDARERVYELNLRDGDSATVTLETPCANLGLRRYRSDDECPATNIVRGAATSSVVGPQQSVTIDSVGRDYRFEIIVDGLDGEEGAFKLKVECN